MIDKLNWTPKGRWNWWVVPTKWLAKLKTEDFKHIEQQGSIDNLIVNGSRAFVANLVRENPFSSPFRAIAVGDASDTSIASGSPNNNITVSALDEKLNNELARAVIPAAGTDNAGAKNAIISDYTTVVRATISPGISCTIKEAGIYGDIARIPNPSTGPTLTATTTGGSLAPNTTYYVVSTWINGNGETLASNSSSLITTTGTSYFTVTGATSLPSTAKKMAVYANTSNSSFKKQGEVTGSNSFTFSSFNASGASPATVNLTLTTGVKDSGTLFNRAFVGPATLNSTDSIIVESQITFG